ncbi:FIG003737: Predicted deacylase [Pseudoalteromonas luteoviolacea B = ATCC 29581]|nr:FIG003737: Predicted deacylase [Pseudoalteromonas luteoviolacea B = ATCC 29581]
MRDVLEINGKIIGLGERVRLELPVARLYTDGEIGIPIEVIRGKRKGPTVFLSAAIHGDELNGIEIIRQVIQSKALTRLKGTVIAVPIVNVHGVLNHSRYLPDRRDLNRSFPGSEKGSLAARVANLFLTEIVHKCDYGIDLHTGAIHRSNLPQIRANLEDEETFQLAKAFGVPVLLNSTLRDGSLRQSASEEGAKILLYEAGEALRFDDISVRAGVKGVLNVLSELGMLPKRKSRLQTEPFVAKSSSWVRATASGIVNSKKQLGDHVKKGEVLAEIGNPFGDVIDVVKAKYAGIVIGKQNIPLVQEGDAMFHVAIFADSEEVAEQIEILTEHYTDEVTG